jgi:hypothetical protein
MFLPRDDTDKFLGCQMPDFAEKAPNRRAGRERLDCSAPAVQQSSLLARCGPIETPRFPAVCFRNSVQTTYKLG